MLQNGEYLDSCISLGTDSSYSTSEDDNVYLARENNGVRSNSDEEKEMSNVAPKAGDHGSTEFMMELQVVFSTCFLYLFPFSLCILTFSRLYLQVIFLVEMERERVGYILFYVKMYKFMDNLART